MYDLKTLESHDLTYIETIVAPLYRKGRAGELTLCSFLRVISIGDELDPSPSFSCLVHGKATDTRARGHESEGKVRYRIPCSFISTLVDDLTRAGELVMEERS